MIMTIKFILFLAVNSPSSQSPHPPGKNLWPTQYKAAVLGLRIDISDCLIFLHDQYIQDSNFILIGNLKM